MPERITLKFIEDLRLDGFPPCEEDVEVFKKFLGKRKYCLLTERNLELASKLDLDVDWFLGAIMYTGRFHHHDSAWVIRYKDGCIALSKQERYVAPGKQPTPTEQV